MESSLSGWLPSQPAEVLAQVAVQLQHASLNPAYPLLYLLANQLRGSLPPTQQTEFVHLFQQFKEQVTFYAYLALLY